MRNYIILQNGNDEEVVIFCDHISSIGEGLKGTTAVEMLSGKIHYIKNMAPGVLIKKIEESYEGIT